MSSLLVWRERFFSVGWTRRHPSYYQSLAYFTPMRATVYLGIKWKKSKSKSHELLWPYYSSAVAHGSWWPNASHERRESYSGVFDMRCVVPDEQNHTWRISRNGYGWWDLRLEASEQRWILSTRHQFFPGRLKPPKCGIKSTCPRTQCRPCSLRWRLCSPLNPNPI